MFSSASPQHHRGRNNVPEGPTKGPEGGSMSTVSLTILVPGYGRGEVLSVHGNHAQEINGGTVLLPLFDYT